MITKLETALGKLTPEQRGELSKEFKKIEVEMRKNEFTEKWIEDKAKIKLVTGALGRVNTAKNTTFGTIKSGAKIGNIKRVQAEGRQIFEEYGINTPKDVQNILKEILIPKSNSGEEIKGKIDH